MLNDSLSSLNLSNKCNVFRVLNNKLSVIMTPTQIRTNVRMSLREHISYVNTKKNVTATFQKKGS